MNNKYMLNCMTIKQLLLISSILLGVIFNSFGQNNCPAIPKNSKFDTLGYVRGKVKAKFSFLLFPLVF